MPPLPAAAGPLFPPCPPRPTVEAPRRRYYSPPWTKNPTTCSLPSSIPHSATPARTYVDGHLTAGPTSSARLPHMPLRFFLSSPPPPIFFIFLPFQAASLTHRHACPPGPLGFLHCPPAQPVAHHTYNTAFQDASAAWRFSSALPHTLAETQRKYFFGRLRALRRGLLADQFTNGATESKLAQRSAQKVR